MYDNKNVKSNSIYIDMKKVVLKINVVLRISSYGTGTGKIQFSGQL